jgi:hypothetical protein
LLKSALILLQIKKNETDFIDIGKEIKEKDRIETLVATLKHFDLDQIYILPALREILDNLPDQRPFRISSDVSHWWDKICFLLRIYRSMKQIRSETLS